jgi:hypothetical protein
MPVNIERRAFVALGLLWLSGVRAHASIDLAGIWSAVARTRGGLGAQMIFTATDATSTFGALVDFKYELDGTLIKMTSMEPANQSPPASMTQEFRIDGNTLTVTSATGVSLVMTRVGAPHRDAHPIVGDWSFTHQTGAPAVQRFSRNGVSQLSVPFKTDKGPYRITDDTLHLAFDGRPALTLTVKRDGDRLITRDAQGREIRFVKFEY